MKKWILAARPKTLTGALIPVILATTLAYVETEEIDWRLFVLCAMFAALMQIAANFINDVYDYKKGTDRSDRLGPERACAQGWITPRAMWIGTAVVIILACLCGMAVVAMTWETLPWHGWEYVILGVTCIIFAFLYTTCLSYLGWGDLLVLVFFGFVPVCGTYYLLANTISPAAITVSLISGIAIDALLAINNYRDQDQDRVSGKRTLVVRFGERFGRLHYLMIGWIVVLCIVVLTFQLEISLTSLVMLLPAIIYLRLHIQTYRQMVAIGEGRALNQILGKTSRNMAVLSLLLAISILIVSTFIMELGVKFV